MWIRHVRHLHHVICVNTSHHMMSCDDGIVSRTNVIYVTYDLNVTRIILRQVCHSHHVWYLCHRRQYVIYVTWWHWWCYWLQYVSHLRHMITSSHHVTHVMWCVQVHHLCHTIYVNTSCMSRHTTSCDDGIASRTSFMPHRSFTSYTSFTLHTTFTSVCHLHNIHHLGHVITDVCY